MDIEIKRMSSDTIELFDQLNIVCKRFHVDYLHAAESAGALHCGAASDLRVRLPLTVLHQRQDGLLDRVSDLFVIQKMGSGFSPDPSIYDRIL